VVNNIFDVGYAQNGAADISPYICPAGGSVFKNNIIYSRATGTLNNDGTMTEEGNGDRVMLCFDDASNHTKTSCYDSFNEMNLNLYYNAVGIAQIKSEDDIFSLEEWKNCVRNHNGYDADSINEDPKFVDAENHDYRLNEDSPAIALGIKPIDTSVIGLLPGFKY